MKKVFLFCIVIIPICSGCIGGKLVVESYRVRQVEMEKNAEGQLVETKRVIKDSTHVLVIINSKNQGDN